LARRPYAIPTLRIHESCASNAPESGKGHRMLRSVGTGLAVAVGILALAVDSSAEPAKRPAVTAAAQVTTDPVPTRAHSSPVIARNPATGELAIVEAEVRTDEQCVVHLSGDDGRSWFAGGSPMRKPFTDCSFHAEYGPYAAMAFGKDGTLYMAFVASEPGPARSEEAAAAGAGYTPRSVFLARSSDSGRSFTTANVFKAPSDNVDRGLNKGPTLAVDPSDSSRVYVGWHQGSYSSKDEKKKSVVAASRDGGKTFSAPVDLSDKNGGDYPTMAVDAEGTLHAIYWSVNFPGFDFGDPKTPVSPIFYRQSTDNGRTFGRPVQVDPGSQNSGRAPVLATGTKPGVLYTVWSDTADPKNLAKGFEGGKDIFFAASRDGGKTWSRKRVLNDDRDLKVDQSLPGISVAPNGRVDVAWYDDRFSPLGKDAGEDEPTAQNVFYTSSDDQGRTFTPNIRISDRSIDRTIGVWANNIESNNYVGIDSTDEGVYFAWQDTRNADRRFQPEDVYTAKLVPDRSSAVTGDDGSNVIWALLGGGAGLLLGGLLLLAAAGWIRRGTPEGVSERSGHPPPPTGSAARPT